MKIQYISDLHAEFLKNAEWLIDNLIPPIGDILIIAGDFNLFKYSFPEYPGFKKILNPLAKKFKTVYWLPGNHEYYEFEITKRKGAFKEAIRENIFLINNHVESFENCRIIFTTL